MIRTFVFTLSLFMFFLAQICLAQDNINMGDPAKDVKEAPVVIGHKEYTFDDLVDGAIVFPSNITKYGKVRFNGRVAILWDSVSRKETRYKANQLTAFIAQKDTFKAVADTMIESDGKNAGKANVDFTYLKQMVYGPRLCLYKNEVISGGSFGYGAGGFGATSAARIYTYFYLKRPTGTGYALVPDGKKDFKKMMTAYIQDNAELVKAINDEQYRYKNLEDIVNIYNQSKISN